MRSVALAIIVGLALVAGAIFFGGASDESEEADRYPDAEKIVTAYLHAEGRESQEVRRVSGPYVWVKLTPKNCLLIDVSTQHDDSFWVAGSVDANASVGC